jgi:FAD/FMN-containing dehydrogenase
VFGTGRPTTRQDGAVTWLEDLRAVVGPSHVLVAPEDVAGHVVDWTGRFRGATPAVVRPATTAEVAEVLGICAEHALAVVPQGGNTGLVGGGVPLAGEVVIDLRRLDHLGPVDLLAGQVTAGAGATLGALQRHLAGSELDVGIDLAARDSATLGGMVATNAGGVHVVRHGPMRAQVAGIEAVLADGSVISHLAGLLKDNTGYDLAGLLCGSEGTLAVVTGVRLRLVPRQAHRVCALIGLPAVGDAMGVMAALRTSVASLEAVELFFDDGVTLVCDRLGLAPPFDPPTPVYLLVEAAARVDPTDELSAAIAATVGDAPVAVAESTAQREALWRYREGHTEALNLAGPPVKLDVTLPASGLEAFIGTVRGRVGAVADGAATYLFGHAADGNVHVNVVGAAEGEVGAVEEVVLTLVADLGGSISAEHGIGTAKRRFLHLNRTPAELAVFRAIKSALDPAGILNPGVLLPPAPSEDGDAPAPAC